MQLSFYNTINLSPPDLAKSESDCKNQEELILSHFKAVRSATPSDVWKKFNQYPITSVRRAITNLTKEGKLQITEQMKMGIYNKPEHFWKLKD